MKKKVVKNIKLQYLLSIFEKALEKFSSFLGATFLKNIIRRLKRLKLKQLEKLIKTFEVDEEVDNEIMETESPESPEFPEFPEFPESLESIESIESDDEDLENPDNYLNKANVICFFLTKLKIHNKISNICYSFIKYILCSNFVNKTSGSFVGRAVTEIKMKYQKTIISSLKKLRSLNILNSFRAETKKENYLDAYKLIKKRLRKFRKKLAKIRKEKTENTEKN